MKFYATWRVYNTRYCGGLTIFLLMLLFMILRPLSAGMGLQFVEMFRGMLLTDIKLTSIFLIICLYGQIVCYYTTQSSSKILTILEDKVIFNAFNGKSIELNYSDLTSLNLTNDIFKNFEFTFKNGEKKVIYATVKNKQQAFNLINQKIQESKNA